MATRKKARKRKRTGVAGVRRVCRKQNGKTVCVYINKRTGKFTSKPGRKRKAAKKRKSTRRRRRR